MLSDLFIFGVNHKILNTEQRSRFSLSTEGITTLYQLAKENSILSLSIINTCNRTELLVVGDINKAKELYIRAVGIDVLLEKKMFTLNGKEAVEHLFHLISGLDSKVIGDLEILGQVKNAFRIAKEEGLLNGYMEKLSNHALQVAKEIKYQTSISDGTTSVAYAVVKVLKKQKAIQRKKILLIGAGNFGKQINKNITTYLPHSILFVTNRTDERARNLAETYGANYIPFSDWKARLHEFDVVISAISEPDNFIIQVEDVANDTTKFFFDLSVPFSIDPKMSQKENVHFYTIDELSEIVNETIEKRKSNIPIAKEIIRRQLAEFIDWSAFHSNSHALREWKYMLQERVQECPFLKALPQATVNKYINKSTAELAKHIRKTNEFPKDKKAFLDIFLAVYHQSVNDTSAANKTVVINA